MRKFTNNTAKLDIQGATVGELVQDLALNYPDLKKHLLDESGKIRTFLNIFVGDDDIRDLEDEKTGVSQGTVVSIVPAIAGGLFHV